MLLFIILFFIMNYSWIKGVVNSVYMRGNLQEGSSGALGNMGLLPPYLLTRSLEHFY